MTSTFDFQDGNGPVPAHRHTNGCGWVADTAYVSESAYIGPDARVYDSARVHGNAVVCDDAVVHGNAVVCGDAVVHGNAVVYGDAVVFDDAVVHCNAVVCGDAVVHGNAVVYGDAWVSGDARINRGEYTETPVTITRSDGYTFTLQADGGVIAGYHYLTREQAVAHWGDPKHHKHAEESMAILTALYAIAEARK